MIISHSFPSAHVRTTLLVKTPVSIRRFIFGDRRNKDGLPRFDYRLLLWHLEHKKGLRIMRILAAVLYGDDDHDDDERVVT